MKRLLLIALFLAGCASTAGVIDKSQPESKATLTLGTITPAAGSQLTKASAFEAQVAWSIENFQPKADYYIVPMFGSKAGQGTTFSGGDSFKESFRVPASTGSVTIRYPVARELASAELARPIRIFLFLMERTSANTTKVIAQQGPFEYRWS